MKPVTRQPTRTGPPHPDLRASFRSTLAALLLMRTSVLSFDDHALRRLKRLAWHARYNARTASEARTVAKVMQAVSAGQVAVRDAHATLSALRADQQATEAAA